MKTLSLDTTSGYLVIAVSDGTHLVAHRKLFAAKAHSELVVRTSSELIRKAGLKPHDIEKIAVVAGPGSFTGIRIGLAFARTVAQTLSIPSVSISSFDALALTAAETSANRRCSSSTTSAKILVLIDALMPSVHWAVYEPSGQKKIAGPGLDTIETVAARFAPRASDTETKKEKWVFAGSALAVPSIRSVLSERFLGYSGKKEKDLSDEPVLSPSPSSLATLAAASRGAIGYKTLKPLYLKEVYLRK
ncbi:MAG: tRNA (adenosine(37)-N6)-threonylcarbamoyltransferase complex dimerization subunit type 1 TsaB [Endomicrobiia bacterium]|nr:tRNA (adenosine(37)-N6)-threonylcarbamoyltransferase complex dimerization subunit type 1 TsaB [Endomicrobiia bacterium]